MIRRRNGVPLTSDLGTDPGALFVGSPEIVTTPLADVIDTVSFTPRLIALLSNALVWRESRLLRQSFNLGTNDWRVISALATRPGATSSDISEFLAMNKAVVSKSVNTLIGRGLIIPADGARGSRPLYLTREGAQMHDRMMPISLEGQEIILGDLSAAEVDQLNSLLARLLLKVPDLSSAPVSSGATDTD
ncbi:MarR family winged helix-turn-helix transcriptional regulator [Microbacterium lushaniae]|uniref:MarR family winged helix-turn-helix transcriptional regulator n=1 Tax=Microbacterium lushaniae TaxID=2614639 RepID=UPI0017873938|nr:MarR family winged helix-turn-helix transcriptional regulator [Microbacterium lushaniae]